MKLLFVVRLLSVLFLLIFFTASCGKDSSSKPSDTESDDTQQDEGITPPSVPGGATTAGGTTTTGGAQSKEDPSQPVHIFKYTGRRTCNATTTSSSEMREQLQRLGISIQGIKKTWKDGKQYSEGCDQPTGEIHVFVIERSSLGLSEDPGGFCECTPDPTKVEVCVPYVYDTPPPGACRR